MRALVDEVVQGFVLDHLAGPDPVGERLRSRTEALGDVAAMQIGPDQALLMTVLARLVGARRAVEVGTFTGASSLAIARGLPDDGHLLCCDVSEEWTAIAQEAWAAAGVADRIELRIAPAIETLRSLPPGPSFDLAFIDADKAGYVAYHDELVPRLRPGGLLLVDNVLWGGSVADPSEPDEGDVAAIRAYDRHAADDPRVEGVIVPTGDGLFVLRRTDAP